MITSQSNTAMHKNLQTTGSNKLPWHLNFWILAVIMIASWGATWLILWLSFRDCNVIGDSANDLKTSWVEAGTFGDMFGCLTCLFTGLSVAALIITLRQQKKAIELQQQELDVFKNEVRTQSIMEHITGIRGIAILLIVLFHYTMGNAQLPDFVRFENGYLGVEIFMCIMGYFSMRGFLAKRNVNILQYISSKATRLLTPPTAILICLVSCTSVFLLDFSHIKLLSGTGTFTLLGLSNFELIRSARDYFATDSSMNAFLHLWYISVAMQLFILALVLYVLLKGRSRKAAILILFFIGIISYCFDSCIEKSIWLN